MPLIEFTHVIPPSSFTFEWLIFLAQAKHKNAVGS